MREIRPSGSEGGVALTTPFLPLSRWATDVCNATGSASVAAAPLLNRGTESLSRVPRISFPICTGESAGDS
jgi:hypothetical protein